MVDRTRPTSPAKGTQHLWFVAPVSDGEGFFDDLMATHPHPTERIRRLRAVAGIPEPSPWPRREDPAEDPAVS